MTSSQILNTSLLDLLFENRNKQYGAYALRKGHDRRLALGLGISISSIVLLLLLLMKVNTTTTMGDPIDEGTVTVITYTLPDPPPQPEVPKVKPAPASTTATVDAAPPVIVPDKTVIRTEVPTVDDLAGAAIGLETKAGLDNPAAALPPTTASGPVATAPVEKEKAASEFVSVERAPEFPGGAKAWADFLSRYLQAPAELGAGERRTVQVRFLVDVDGSVTGFTVVQSAGSSFDREVVRVLKKMPRWKPAVQNGRFIATSFIQPVTFQAVEE